MHKLHATAGMIVSGESRTSTATAVTDATSLTYSIAFSQYFGMPLAKKGCRAQITLLLIGGKITEITSHSWKSYASNSSCSTTFSPQISGDGSSVTWDVRYNAS